jgi:ornithine--oxo-acid transaminase
MQHTNLSTTLEAQHSARNYHPLPVVLTRGQGVYLWDEDGKRYVDMMSAYSAVSFGHGHPKLLAALTAQASQLAVTSRAFHTDQLGSFLKAIVDTTGLTGYKVLPMNTGAEAVETAVKAARKWGHKVKGIAAGQAEIIVCTGNFAGRTTTIVSFSTEDQYRDGFGPFTPGFKHVPFGDAETLEKMITPNTAAFIVEPVQGEAGIIVPPAGYLAKCAEICKRHNVLLICDEVQTGLGRTGRVLACDHENVKPDGITLGKALGGGLLPVSAFVARADVMDVFRPGDHGSTFGGNPLACAVGRTALQVLLDERLSERAEATGKELIAELRSWTSPLIKDVRGKGLLVGVEIDPAYATAREVCEMLLKYGVLSKDTHHTVVRFAPPLNMTPAELHDALTRVKTAFSELEHERVKRVA